MTSIMFLDIGGVLNSVQYALRVKDDSPHLIIGLDPAAVGLVDMIIDETTCDVIISSSQRRIYTIEELRIKLGRVGMMYTEAVIGATPIFHGSASRGLKRGHEVNAWLNARPLRGVDITFCCIDDDADYLPNQPLVLVDSEYGLTMKDAHRAIHMLKRK